VPVSALLANAVLFQIAWFAALYGGIEDWLTLTLLPACVAVIWHLFLRRRSLLREIALVAATVLLGFGVETLYVTSGVIVYSGQPLFGFGPPLSILAMWLAFATLPHGCLGWLQGKKRLQILLGGLLGPPSYLAGAKLGGAILSEPVWLSLLLIGAGWAMALPVLFRLAEFLEEPSGSPAPSRS
jgi:Protein of unknown function (DUF2878)